LPEEQSPVGNPFDECKKLVWKIWTRIGGAMFYAAMIFIVLVFLAFVLAGAEEFIGDE